MKKTVFRTGVYSVRASLINTYAGGVPAFMNVETGELYKIDNSSEVPIDAKGTYDLWVRKFDGKILQELGRHDVFLGNESDPVPNYVDKFGNSVVFLERAEPFYEALGTRRAFILEEFIQLLISQVAWIIISGLSGLYIVSALIAALFAFNAHEVCKVMNYKVVYDEEMNWLYMKTGKTNLNGVTYKRWEVDLQH